MSTTPAPPRWRIVLPLAALLLLTALVYTPSFSNEFVYDDHRFVQENLEIRDLGNFVRFFTDPRTMTATQGSPGWNDIYRPLRTLSYAIDHALFGGGAFWFRVQNLVWHLVAVVLAWFLLRRLLSSSDLATVGAGVFALHPLQTQSVAWVSSRGDLMAAVFVLGACLLLLRENRSLAHRIGGCCLYALALMSKESAISLLALVVAYDLILAASPRFDRWLLVAMTAMTGSFLAVRFTLATAQAEFHAATFLGAGNATLVMFWEVLFPVRLLPYTGDVLFAERIRNAAGGILLASFTALVVLAIWKGRRWPRLAYGLLWAAACFAPVASLVPLKSVAESRFAYLPLIGMGILLGLLVRRTGAPGRRVSVVVLLLLAAATAGESRAWSTDRELWKSAIRKAEVYRRPRADGLHRGGDVALVNYGVAVASAGDHEGALYYFEEALETRESPECWGYLATANSNLGRHERALEAAWRGLRLDPHSPSLTTAYGRESLTLGRLREALDSLGRAVQLAPRYVPARSWLGLALLDSGRLIEAKEQLAHCLDLAPGDPWVLNVLAAVRLQGGELAQALELSKSIMESDPGNPDTRAMLIGIRWRMGEAISMKDAETFFGCLDLLESRRSILVIQVLRGLWPIEEYEIRHRLMQGLFRLGRLPEAEDRLVDMRRTWPEHAEVALNLGRVRLMLRKYGDAIQPLEHASSLVPESFEVRLSLARAYRGAGRRADAVRAAEKARSLARTDADRAEMRMYRAGK